MRFIRIAILSIIVFNLYHCTDKEPQDKKLKTDKEALLTAIGTFNTAFREGDLTVLASMITEDYIHTNGNSRAIGKEDWIAYLRKRKRDIESGKLAVIEYNMEETDIVFYGNTAIVTAKIVVATQRQDVLQKNAYRVTNVWITESGHWKRAGFHDTKIN